MTNTFEPLTVAVLGGGLGGLAAALALRRQGHKVTVYERYDYAGEVGASLSCASNGGRWLHEWGVDPLKAKPVILTKLIKRNWSTGEIVGTYPLGDYKQKFGFPYYNFHRIDIHTVLREYVVSPEGDGPVCELVCNHKAVKVDYQTGYVEFENGNSTTADLVVAADGIRSLTKPQLGITPQFRSSDSSCIRVLFNTADVRAQELVDFSNNDAIEFWGDTRFKIVLSPCSNNEVISCYCFYEAGEADVKNDWNNEVSLKKLISCCEGLDPTLIQLFTKCGYDIRQWRLYVHEPLPYFQKSSDDETKGVALLGDAAHAMMPDQSQGAVAAFEDAAALGCIFCSQYSHLTLGEKLKVYELVRKDRVTRIQQASLRARENLNERIGWSSGADLKDKLTIEEVCGYDMKAHVQEIVNSL